MEKCFKHSSSQQEKEGNNGEGKQEEGVLSDQAAAAKHRRLGGLQITDMYFSACWRLGSSSSWYWQTQGLKVPLAH